MVMFLFIIHIFFIQNIDIVMNQNKIAMSSSIRDLLIQPCIAMIMNGWLNGASVAGIWKYPACIRL